VILQEEFRRNEERFDKKAATGEKKESEREQNKTDAKLTAAARCFINSAKVEGHDLTLTFEPPPREPPTAGGAGNVLGNAAGALGDAAGFVAGVANNPLVQIGASLVPGGGAALALAGTAAGAVNAGVEVATDVKDHGKTAAK
jgi:hypothetical protein